MLVHRMVARSTLMLILAAVFLVIGSAVWAAEEAATFTFNPPDGTKQISIDTKTTTWRFGDEKEVEKDTSRTQVVFHKAKAGYTVKISTLASSMTINDEKIDDPFLDILNSLVLTYHVNEKARLEKISGQEELYEKIREQMPKEESEALIKELNSKNIFESERYDWDCAIGNLHGKTLKPGGVWVGFTEEIIPGGDTVPYYVVSRFEGWQQVDGKKCARIGYVCSTDIEALGATYGKEVQQQLKKLKLPRISSKMIVSATITGEGQTLMDPATMLTYRDRESLSIRVKLKGPEGQTMTITGEENSDSRSEFQKETVFVTPEA